MTSETDHPRQRTVAELLAEHGDGAATGRRRRRRADGPDDVESSGGSGGYAPSRPSYDYAPPAAPDRRILREPVPQDDPPYRAPEAHRPAAYDTPRERPRETPTDRMPRVPERAPQRFAEPPPPPMAPPQARPQQRPAMGDAGPRNMAGPAPAVPAPAGAEPWNRPRTEAPRTDQPRTDQRLDDGGPPTQAGALDLDDYDDDEYDDDYRDDYREGDARDDEYRDDDEYDDEYDEDDDYEDDPRRARGVAGLRDDDDRDDLDEYEDEFDDEDADERPSRRRQREDEPVGAQSWGAVVAQWIIGAIGGAMLWVAFRFLWRDLMVVAIFAAILVTAGLVLGVRHLLRTTDTRTTAFAVGVGLLLTVSPVVLILLGR